MDKNTNIYQKILKNKNNLRYLKSKKINLISYICNSNHNSKEIDIINRVVLMQPAPCVRDLLILSKLKLHYNNEHNIEIYLTNTYLEYYIKYINYQN